MGLRLHVAIVDVDDEALWFCRSTLETAGHAVVLFSSAEELIGNAPWLANLDVLVVDAGFECALRTQLEELHDRYPHVGIVLMTNDPSLVEQAIAEGHLPLVKPFSPRQLLSAVEDLAHPASKPGGGQ